MIYSPPPPTNLCALYRKAYFLDPSDIDVLLELGDASIKAVGLRGRQKDKRVFSEHALSAYKKVLSSSNNSHVVRSHYGMGIAYQVQGMYKEALESFEACIPHISYTSPKSERVEKVQKQIQKILRIYDRSAGVLIITGTWVGTGGFNLEDYHINNKGEIKIEQIEGGKIRGYFQWTDEYGGGVKEGFEGTVDEERRVTFTNVYIKDIVNKSGFFTYRDKTGWSYLGTASEDGKTIHIKSSSCEYVLKKR